MLKSGSQESSVGESLRVLITNNALAHLGGTETYVKTLCQYLLRQGHYPTVYSAQMGALSIELTRIGACVTDTLLDIAPPDIIHGHHRLDTTYALLCFPNAPCLSFCHGVIPWEELPAAKLSRIYQYIAISENTKASLLGSGVPEDKIEIMHNFVDEDRFKLNASLDRLRLTDVKKDKMKALVYGNYLIRDLGVIESACESCNYTVDKAGLPYGRPIESPELLLPQYDVVFCYGKSAMESLYSGCHVILAHSTGTGARVDENNFDSLQKKNFGVFTCQDEPEYSDLCEKLNAVTSIRRESMPPIQSEQLKSLESSQVLGRLVSTYREAIQHHYHISSPSCNERNDQRALASYIQFLQKSRLAREISYSPSIDAKSANKIHELENIKRELGVCGKTVRNAAFLPLAI